MQWLTNERFGNGSDGVLSISTDTTEAPIDSACTGTSATKTLTATNVSFAANQIILIHQTQETGAGNWELNVVSSYIAGSITTKYALANTYVSGAQVRVLKQYTNATISSGKKYTAKSWDGTVGGILAFIANGTTSIVGDIVGKGTDGNSSANPAGVSGGGFRSGAGNQGKPSQAQCGEGTVGGVASQYTANGNGGGGGGTASNSEGAGGGGGANGTSGSNGTGGGAHVGVGGSVIGSADLITATFGGGGGGGGNDNNGETIGSGGSGGNFVLIISPTITVTGTVSVNGGKGGDAGVDGGGGGGGAGGSILFKSRTSTFGTGLVTASGGNGGANGGGAGGAGCIHLDYASSFTGTTTPTLNSSANSYMGNVFFGGVL